MTLKTSPPKAGCLRAATHHAVTLDPATASEGTASWTMPTWGAGMPKLEVKDLKQRTKPIYTC